MRAGGYAEWRGELYSCGSVFKPYVLLQAWGDAPAVGGFDRDHNGMWYRLVDRSEVSRLQSVETWAVWQGRRVEVRYIRGDKAWIEQWQNPVPDHPAAQALENGLWGGLMPVSELSEVVETVTEVPL